MVTKTFLRGVSVLVGVTLLSGCATIHKVSDWLQKQDPNKPPAEVAYVVTEGQQECRNLTVPAWVEIKSMIGKQPGTAEREEVMFWAVTEGEDWRGGNPLPPTFGVRCNDSRPTWAKLKVYREGHAGVSEKEKPLNMAWVSTEAYTTRLAIDVGEVTWTATRLSDKFPAEAKLQAPTPKKVTLCIGDPKSRKAAMRAKYTGVSWSEP